MRNPPPHPPPYGSFQNQEPPGDQNDFLAALTPKTVVQFAVWILMFGLGAGLSGLLLFVIYQGQVNDLRSELLESQEELRRSLEERIGGGPAPEETPNLNVSATPSPEDLTEQVVTSAGPAVVGIVGRGSGGPVTGSGFVVNTADSGTWVITSNKLVSGVQGPTELRVRHKNSQLAAEVYESDPTRDLALVIYQVPGERSLRFSRGEDPTEGDQVWALGHTRNSPYVTGRAARLTTVSSGVLGLDVELPEGFLGGPLIDVDGRVLGVITKTGASSSATPINLACQRVIRCPGRSSGAASPTPSPGGEQPAEPAEPADPAQPAPPPEEPGALIQPPPSNPNTADVPIG